MMPSPTAASTTSASAATENVTNYTEITQDVTLTEDRNEGEILETATTSVVHYPSDVDNGTYIEKSNSLVANTFVPVEGSEFYIFVDTDFPNGDDRFSAAKHNLETAKNIIRVSFTVILMCVIIAGICVIILILGAGRKKGEEGLYIPAADVIFTDWRIALNGAAVFGLGLLCLLIIEADILPEKTILTLCVLLCCIATALIIDLILFITRHIKNKSFIKRLSVIWFIEKGYRFFKNKAVITIQKAAEKYDFIKDLSKAAFIKCILFFAVNAVLCLFAATETSYSGDLSLFVLIGIGDLVCFFFFMRYLCNLKIVLKNLELLRKGNYNVSINTYNMPASVKQYADNIINLRDGLVNAVDDAIRQEQTKTELITNVSHDLKTPLTSIINYVDLLKKCDISDESAKEYLDILGEKSDRLKKLIEDLVEASKASTGNIKVELMSVSLNEMINQLLGEHADNLDKKRLNVICTLPDNELTVKADGKLLYRVFENLIVNVEKYSLYGTRVYVTAEKKGSDVIVSFKNISELPLNITAEQLKERFVRGDSSRSTDGNGLGLSIAESLCNIQGCRLELNINGDLFTAKVIF